MPASSAPSIVQGQAPPQGPAAWYTRLAHLPPSPVRLLANTRAIAGLPSPTVARATRTEAYMYPRLSSPAATRRRMCTCCLNFVASPSIASPSITPCIPLLLSSLLPSPLVLLGTFPSIISPSAISSLHPSLYHPSFHLFVRSSSLLPSHHPSIIPPHHPPFTPTNNHSTPSRISTAAAVPNIPSASMLARWRDETRKSETTLAERLFSSK